MLKECVTRLDRLTTNSLLSSFNRVLTNGLTSQEGNIMEFGMKRVMASVQAVAVLTEIYGGAPVSIATISKKSKLSISYLEQIFRSYATANLSHLTEARWRIQPQS
jgi:hypothetical protein